MENENTEEDMILEVDAQSPVSLRLFGTVDVKIDWGDGTITTETSPGIKTNNYLISGRYEVKISGSLTGFGWEFVNVPPEGGRITKVKRWGNLGLTSLSGVFNNNNFNVEILDNIPSTVTDLSGMFYLASNFNRSIGSWDTRNVTNMSSMFFSAVSFNQPIGSWNTGNVTNMSNMFRNTQTFNQSVGDWDTRNVTNMSNMFFNADAFNQTIGSWDTGNVTNMSSMFENASAFNQPIGSWNTSNVVFMRFMFLGAQVFNQNIRIWNTSNVISYDEMFAEASAMINEYDGTPGFGETPTSDFFNHLPE